jgi:hypothetical protein
MEADGRSARAPWPLLIHSVDMTSDVKSRRKNSQLVFFMVMSSWGSDPAAEPEPVNPTVDPADIRGLATT